LRFEPPIEPPRAELFLAGAEVNRIQVITDARPRLAYPDDGSILALDPDIAADQQRVALNVTSTRTDLVWSNGRPTA
jgi:penicillin-binding protein 1C